MYDKLVPDFLVFHSSHLALNKNSKETGKVSGIEYINVYLSIYIKSRPNHKSLKTSDNIQKSTNI